MALEQSVVINVSTAQAQQNLSSLSSSLNNTTGASSALTSTIGKLAGAIGVTFGASQAINQVIAFENAMAGVSAVSRATASEMANLTEQARLLGATTSFGAEQAAGAQRFLAQAGLEVNEVLAATPTLLNLAKAGQLELAESADIATNVLSGFRLEVNDLSKVADVLAETAASSNTNIQQLGQALSFAAPLAAAAGVSIEETSAAIGVLSDNGLQASRAGTGFVGIIRQLSKVTPDAQKALLSYGLTLEDVDITTRGLRPVLESLKNANISVSDSFTIFGTEAGSAAQALIASSESADALTSKLQDASGAAKSAALVLGDTLGDSIKGLSSALSEAILQSGDSGLSGALRTLIDTSTGVIQSYNGMLDVFAEANDLSADQIENIEILEGAMTALATVIGAGLIGNLAKLGVSFAATQVAVLATAGSVGILQGALALLGGPVGILAIAAVSLGVWVKGMNDAEEATKNAKLETDEFIASLENASIIQFSHNLANATKEVEDANRALDSVNKQLALLDSSSSLAKALQSRIPQLQKDLDEADEALAAVENSFFDAATAAQEYGKQVKSVKEDEAIRSSSSSIVKSNKEKSLSFEELISRYSQTEAAAINYNIALKEIESSTSSVEEKTRLIGYAQEQLVAQTIAASDGYDALRASLDPVYALTLAHEQTLASIASAKITDAQATELQNLAVNKYNESLKTLSGDLSKSTETANNYFDALKQGFADASVSTESDFDKMRAAGAATYNSLANGLTEFISTGELDIKSFASTVIAEFVKIAAQKAIAGFASSIFGGIGGGGNTAAITDVGNNSVAQSFPIPGFASGGIPTLSSSKNSVVDGTSFFAAGEAGSEAILPLTRTSSGNLGVEAITGGGSGTQVVNNINITSDGSAQVEETSRSTNSTGGLDLNLMVRRAVETGISNGQFDASLGNSFGLRRRGA